MNLFVIQHLIGEHITVNNKSGKVSGRVGGIHVYFNKRGVQSIRIHFVGTQGYVSIRSLNEITRIED